MSESRLISSFPLSSTIISKLLNSGFRSVDDLLGLEPLDIQEEANISKDDALQVWKYIHNLEKSSYTDTTASTSSNSTTSATSSSTGIMIPSTVPSAVFSSKNH